MSLWNGHTRVAPGWKSTSSSSHSFCVLATQCLVRPVLVSLFTAALCTAPSMAQTTSGSFIGRITDPSGSVVPNASVEITNEATAVTATATTNQAGEYIFNYVQPGVYRVSVTSTGFQKQVAQHLNLDIKQTVREDFSLSLGSTDSTVTVSAETPLIQTDSAQVGSVIDEKQIRETPINGRLNGYALMALAPGVQRPNSNALFSGSSFKGGANMTIDGVSSNDVNNARMTDQMPSIEAVSQFNVIGVNAPAEYGNGGAQVIVLTKSGTNEIHGSVFEFNRNRYFQARNFFLPKTSPLPAFNRNEYGFAVGGPVIKNRLFLFGSFEDARSVTATTRLYTMPTAAFLSGDFSQYTSLNGKPTVIYDPSTGLPFANNQIPASRISATSKKFLQYWSTPNTATTNGITNNFTYSSPTIIQDPRWSIRADYQVSSADHIMFRYYKNHYNAPRLDQGGTDKLGNYAPAGTYTDQFASTYTRVFTSQIVNELIFGVNKRHDVRVDQNNSIDPPSLVAGLPATSPGWGLLPTVNVTGIQRLGATGSFEFPQHTIQLNDNLAIQKGTHNIKVGGQFLAEQESNTQYNTGSFSFDGRYTGRYTLTGQASNSVNAFADFLLGDMYASSTANKSNAVTSNAKLFALYVNDSWDVTPSLTLNVGVRYDKMFPFQVTKGGLGTFDPSLGAVVRVAGTADPALVAKYPVVDGASINYVSSNWLHLQNLNFAPRFGFAYRPFKAQSFVVRGGYGIYYNNLSQAYLVNNPSNQIPFILTTSYNAASQTVPDLTFDSPFPSSGASAANPSAYGVGRTLKTPYNQQFNLTIEDEVWKRIALRASYIGNLGTHLHMPYGVNDYIPQPVGGPGQPATIQAARPFQPFGTITQYLYGESTNTNQMQLAARRRFADLTFDLEYQYTKALGIDGPNDEVVTNRLNIRQDYGNLDFYARHALSLSYSYNLPFGRGRWMFSNANRMEDAVLGGWKFSGVWKATSGLPFSAMFNSSLNGFPSGRANYVAGAALYPQHPSYKGWFNLAAFTNPANYTWGNSQRNMLYGPSFSEWDAALSKEFSITERVKFNFRAEAFDLLNRTNFSNPASNISLPTAGIVSSTAADNRELQFGGRLSF